MKLSKEKKALFSLIAGIILAIVGLTFIFQSSIPAKQARQVAFLKEHEDEMTEYIKNKNPKSKIATVKYDWQSFKVDSSGAFTGKMYVLSIDLYDLNKNEINGGIVLVHPNNLKSPTEIKQISTNYFDGDVEN